MNMTGKPLNGTKTHPLSEHALAELQTLASEMLPCMYVNPGVINRLKREDLVEIVDAPSPFKSHEGKKIPHLRITDAGRKRLEQQ